MSSVVQLSRNERAERGIRARSLLADPLLNETLDRLESTTIEGWKQCNDPVDRERAWLLVKAVDLLRSELKAIAGDGEAAEAPKPVEPV